MIEVSPAVLHQTTSQLFDREEIPKNPLPVIFKKVGEWVLCSRGVIVIRTEDKESGKM